MLRLTTLGGLALLQDGTPHVGPASQRRRLALLALVAASGARGISREKLVGLLWPESDEASGRHSLHQALHVLRRALGGEDVFLGTTALQLNTAMISSDAAEFDDAIRRKAYERAAQLYAGPFLDGFYLEGADDFQRWLDAERLRYARDHAAALEALAAAATARNDHRTASRWWRQLATAEPVSTRAALGLIESLVAAGGRADALQFAKVHSTLVREHLDVEPDPAIERWIARLRAGDFSPAPSSPAPAPPRGRPPAGAEDAAVASRREGEQLVRTFGERFAIGEKISEGAMLTSFAARDRRNTRAVELHLVSPRLTALAGGARALEALERSAALADPRIHPIAECGTAGGIVYFVTEPADGVSLRERLARERQLPIAEAVRIAVDVAAALVHAHARDVRHGDLRPKHVLLTPTGTRVASLGLLEALDVAAGGDAADSTAIMMGAPAYLSPEQLAGEVVADERSDLYSAGCILFEMLAGAPPFAGSNQAALLGRKLTESAPPLRSVRDSAPAALERILATCLARVPADRYRSAVELHEALEAVYRHAGPADE